VGIRKNNSSHMIANISSTNNMLKMSKSAYLNDNNSDVECEGKDERESFLSDYSNVSKKSLSQRIGFIEKPVVN
jgi:hypothetical protein